MFSFFTPPAFWFPAQPEPERQDKTGDGRRGRTPVLVVGVEHLLRGFVLRDPVEAERVGRQVQDAADVDAVRAALGLDNTAGKHVRERPAVARIGPHKTTAAGCGGGSARLGPIRTVDVHALVEEHGCARRRLLVLRRLWVAAAHLQPPVVELDPGAGLRQRSRLLVPPHQTHEAGQPVASAADHLNLRAAQPPQRATPDTRNHLP